MHSNLACECRYSSPSTLLLIDGRASLVNMSNIRQESGGTCLDSCWKRSAAVVADVQDVPFCALTLKMADQLLARDMTMT